MPLCRCFLSLCLLCFATLASCYDTTHSYFTIKEPQGSTQWLNNAVNVLSWEKGVWDGLTFFDIEMTRLNVKGITYVAFNVQALPSSPTSLNIYLEDVPTGDDYFMVFINSTHMVRHCLSDRFSIVNATDVSSASASASVTPDSTIPTVTISGSPNPTKVFITTFASRASSVVWGWGSGQACGGVALVVGLAVGAMMALW
ncbi:uncharacterized protein EV420DRAFT_1478506 [Desarmillaria tabescens]|uniref:Uncharacterized protein n=1 Tax=Armillaria tabescens TaxID=1929756 RepID=A0AA39KIP5_ARMTA|nr:uncharacterized protein EV420DRAFT_1478506 [Desarmillaria tabescens]KAK0459958.1 hypothetical protein EV420DRAFT_1478506 [Desarmillaria tabescens]